MASRTYLLLAMILSSCLTITIATERGKWKLLKTSIGVSAMHMALLPNNKIIVFDRTDSGPSNISLPHSKCAAAAASGGGARGGCSAHSVEFDPSTRGVRPLTILTDTWCSSGALSSEGVLVQTGGFEAGERVVRVIKPCDSCDWVEVSDGLASSRWYASNQVLPDGRIIVVGGRREFSYEFVGPTGSSDRRLYGLPFLQETRYSERVPNNLYPFLHLSPDGSLFIFANDRAILLDYRSNRVLRRFPPIPAAGAARNYPSTGSSAMLPIILSGNGTAFSDAVVMVCGGAPAESSLKASVGEYVPAERSCGRIDITAEEPRWEVETMPVERVMGDMIMLPTGDILIVNGARKGAAGWNAAREPVLTPVLYKTGTDQVGSRFVVLSPASVPRLYHSTAHLLPDGRVLVGGSNPNRSYNFSAEFPTELSLEVFYPPYMAGKNNPRPTITSLRPGSEFGYGERISVRFRSSSDATRSKVTMVAPSFTTHSQAMNQRLLVLDVGEIRKSGFDYAAEGYAPGMPEIAPPGYYLLFVVVDGVPSRGLWVHIK